MKRKLLISLAVLLLLTGVGFLLYPSFRTTEQKFEERHEIAAFEEYRAEESEAEAKRPASNRPNESEEAEKPVQERKWNSLWNACVAYNAEIYLNRQINLTEEAMRQPGIVLSDYGWKKDVIGYISIPAADIEVPLYLGGSLANLEKGGAIIGQTSMPIGGENTRCVIAGHRSWGGAIVFRSLEKLKGGDKVYLTNPWQTLIYEVERIQIINPDESDEIRIEEGRDLLSIFTCTYPNTRRVLVTCTRILNEGGTQINGKTD